MTIAPKETWYGGRKYRSRLEARYAVLFDQLRIKFDYEHDRYDLDSGSYLPDFWLHELDFWAEIKPVLSSPGLDPDKFPIEFQLCLELSEATETSVLLFQGSPWPLEHLIWFIDNDHEPDQSSKHYFDACNAIVACPCGGLTLSGSRSPPHSPTAPFINFDCHLPLGEHVCTKGSVLPLGIALTARHLFYAYTAARSARFEYGETPQLPR